MNVTTIGIDLAKTVFSIHGTDQHGKVVVRKRLNRPKLLAFFAQLPPCLIGMEACSGAHYWAREMTKLGHDARIIAPRFVAPYRKSSKNDDNDAEAICEAVSRPNMRFVPIKTEDQQATLSLHRIRRGLTKERTAQINQIRGLLAEFGLIIPQSVTPHAAGFRRSLRTPKTACPCWPVAYSTTLTSASFSWMRKSSLMIGKSKPWHGVTNRQSV
tara:strand:- start:2237 stop:2878 length:642 start_codon:yes stop_codon:yes gene_type:complete